MSTVTMAYTPSAANSSAVCVSSVSVLPACDYSTRTLLMICNYMWPDFGKPTMYAHIPT